MALLQYQRESVVRKVTDVDEEAARRSPVDSGTSLLWLVAHLARAETLWVVHRFAGRDDGLPDDGLGSGVTVDSAVAAYRQAWLKVDGIVESADLDQRCRWIEDGEPPSLRWVLMHLLEETARHAGHADILREMIDGDTGR
jgi:uncharacterized damage-inducible protein DinB